MMPCIPWLSPVCGVFFSFPVSLVWSAPCVLYCQGVASNDLLLWSPQPSNQCTCVRLFFYPPWYCACDSCCNILLCAFCQTFILVSCRFFFSPFVLFMKINHNLLHLLYLLLLQVCTQGHSLLCILTWGSLAAKLRDQVLI